MKENENKHEQDQLYIPLTFTRHTYSRANAQRFKEIIDKSINKKTDEFISAESLGVSVLTLRHRLSEALLWLCNNDIENSIFSKEDYIRVRPFLKTTPVSYGNKPGILLSWKVVKYTKSLASNDKLKAKNILNTPSSDTVVNKLSKVNLNTNVAGLHWKDRVIEFITDDNKSVLIIDKPEDFRHIPLNDTDIEWLTTTFSKAGLEFEVDTFSIKAVKG